jgi:hypothetical protein
MEVIDLVLPRHRSGFGRAKKVKNGVLQTTCGIASNSRRGCFGARYEIRPWELADPRYYG